MEEDKCNKKLHGKFWTGKFGYFWVNDECTLYCHYSKCNRFFEIGINKKNKDFEWGQPIYKGVTIEYGV